MDEGTSHRGRRLPGMRGITLAALIGIFAGAVALAFLDRLLPGRLGRLVRTIVRRGGGSGEESAAE